MEVADLSKTGVSTQRNAVQLCPPTRRRAAAGLTVYCMLVLVAWAWSRSPVTCPFHSCSVSRTNLPQVTDEGLAALGCPAHLTCLRLDYCVDVTDAGLALLQGEWRKLPDVAAAE